MYRNSFRLTNKEIDAAFAERQFRLVFQPKINLAERTMVGVEAFARWQHPEFGVIPPALFLPVLARQGRNQELTRFVLGDAIAQLVRWRDQDPELTVSVNVAPEELADGSLPVSIRVALNAADLPADRLVVDLPERGLAAEPARAADTINALHQIGVSLALECAAEPLIDLSDPQNLLAEPGTFSELKIGGQAIIQFASRLEGTGLGLLHNRLTFAKNNAMRTTAVGAETPQTVQQLVALGFTQAQGNAISPPLTAQDMADFDFTAAMQALNKSSHPDAAKPVLAEIPPLPDTTPAASATRIRVLRGNARIELLTQGNAPGNSNEGKRITRLSIPKTSDVKPGEDAPADASRHGWLHRIQSHLSRNLPF